MVHIAFLGVGVKDGHVMDYARSKLSEFDLRISVADSMSLDEDLDRLADFLRLVRELDFMVIHVHGDVSYFRHFEELRKTLESSKCSALLVCGEFGTTAQYRYLFRQDDSQYDIVRKFQEIGGDENQYATAAWALRTFGGYDIDVPDAVVPLTEGYYNPADGALPLDRMPQIPNDGRPRIAVIFHQRYWLVHNTMAIDYLIGEVEKRGAIAVPLFMITHENPITGSIGIRNVIDRYLIKNGKPIIDCVINTMGFSQTLIANPGCGEQVSDDNFFQRLDVPVLQAITLFDDPKEWLENEMGMNAADIAIDRKSVV